MSVQRQFKDAVHLIGSVSPDALAEYISRHAQVGLLELAGKRRIFPSRQSQWTERTRPSI